MTTMTLVYGMIAAITLVAIAVILIHDKQHKDR